MIKRSIFTVMLSFSASVYAVPESLQMHTLDNHALSLISGQASAQEMQSDYYGLHLAQLHSIVQRLTTDKNAESESAYSGQVFHVNAKGELWLSLQRDTVSVGVIECELNFKGLNQFNNTMASNIQIH